MYEGDSVDNLMTKIGPFIENATARGRVQIYTKHLGIISFL